MPIIAIIGGREVAVRDSERQPCEIWTRVMGYYRPLSDWNAGKKSEYAERVFCEESKIKELRSTYTRSADTPDPTHHIGDVDDMV